MKWGVRFSSALDRIRTSPAEAAAAMLDRYARV